MSPRLVIALTVAWLVATSVTGAATADTRRPDGIAGAFLLGETPLVVNHVELAFHCIDAGEAPCELRATYEVENPSDARQEVFGTFFTLDATRVSVTVNGLGAVHDLPPDLRSGMLATLAGIDPALVKAHAVLAPEGFLLKMGPRERATLVFEALLHARYHPRERTIDGWFALPAHRARHPLLSTRELLPLRAEYLYVAGPTHGWKGSPAIDVSVRFPRDRVWDSGDAAWALGDDGRESIARTTIAPGGETSVRFAFVEPGTTLLNGGPFVAIGGRGDAPELRARFGYEVAYPFWLVYSAAVETSFQGRTTLVPLAEAVTPDITMLLPPSVGLGAGVPVQLRSGQPALVGLRAQLTVSTWVASFVMPLDWFPSASGKDALQLGLFGQLSF